MCGGGGQVGLVGCTCGVSMAVALTQSAQSKPDLQAMVPPSTPTTHTYPPSAHKPPQPPHTPHTPPPPYPELCHEHIPALLVFVATLSQPGSPLGGINGVSINKGATQQELEQQQQQAHEFSVCV